ncbi:MAG TPA: hypothetical protein VGR67_16235 [Candidatus Polarisedimenticolia bacterium]|nr:hypothetical protein [Candidatus Polarisedimenticolia bacterium]
MFVGSASLAKDKDKAAPPLPPVRVTVGEFALKAITIVSDDPQSLGPMTADEAISRLRRAGVNFQGSASDPVTETEKSSFFFAVANGLLERLAPAPAGFEACRSLASVTECRACCLALEGANQHTCGRACGRAHADLQHASASEPTP